MNYEKIIKKYIDGEEINYGIILGNDEIVFIKTGAGGSINGYKDKYLKMSQRIHKKIGATVVCSSNPYIENGHNLDEAIITQIALEEGYLDYKVYLVGVSDGAYHNFTLANNIPKAQKLLCINPSTISFDDLREHLQKLSHISKILVYGTKDDEYSYVNLLNDVSFNNLEIITIEGADHQFTGMLDKFIALVDLL